MSDDPERLAADIEAEAPAQEAPPQAPAAKTVSLQFPIHLDRRYRRRNCFPPVSNLWKVASWGCSFLAHIGNWLACSGIGPSQDFLKFIVKFVELAESVKFHEIYGRVSGEPVSVTPAPLGLSQDFMKFILKYAGSVNAYEISVKSASKG